MTSRDCHAYHQAELSQWQVDQATQKPADKQVSDFFKSFANGIGLYQGEELFERRLSVCLNRVGRIGTSLVPQPGSGGNARVFACKPGGGVFQGGGAICPGH